MRLKKTLIFILISIFVLQLCSCSPEKRQVKSEMTDFINCIFDNIDNSDIKIDEKHCSETSGIYIILYGSDKSEDIFNLIDACNQWIDNNQNSYVVSERLEISVELYLQKNTHKGYRRLNYVARIGNHARNSRYSDISNAFDCLEIRYCDNLKSSVFRSMPVNYQYISLPSTVEIDDFEVFADMTNLNILIIDDNDFEVDPQRVRDKYNEIIEIADDYPDLQFEIYYLSSVLD